MDGIKIVDIKGDTDWLNYAYTICECINSNIEAIQVPRLENEDITREFTCPRCGKWHAVYVVSKLKTVRDHLLFDALAKAKEDWENA